MKKHPSHRPLSKVLREAMAELETALRVAQSSNAVIEGGERRAGSSAATAASQSIGMAAPTAAPTGVGLPWATF